MSSKIIKEKIIIRANSGTETIFKGEIPYSFVQDIIIKLIDKYEDSEIIFSKED